jgi:hypothetical protein
VVIYRERLTVPVAWWLLGGLFAFSAMIAVGWYRGLFWGVATGAAAAAIAGAIFATASIRITVNAGELAVGRARIELSYLSDAIPLDKHAASHRAGPGADARAFLVIRPYIAGAVEITLVDPDDPVPYWLISTRHPGQLASALSAAISTRGGLH